MKLEAKWKLKTMSGRKVWACDECRRKCMVSATYKPTECSFEKRLLEQAVWATSKKEVL